MGNITISTSETSIYYPADWLVTGGSPYATMGCPDDTQDDYDDDFLLKLVYNETSGKWQVIETSSILMESMNKRDVVKYFLDFMEAMEWWLYEQDQDNYR